MGIIIPFFQAEGKCAGKKIKLNGAVSFGNKLTIPHTYNSFISISSPQALPVWSSFIAFCTSASEMGLFNSLYYVCNIPLLYCRIYS